MEFPDGSGICLAFLFWKFHRGGEVRSYGKSLLWEYGYFLELLDEYLSLTFALKSDMEISRPCVNFVSYKSYLAYNRVKLSFLSEYSFAIFYLLFCTLLTRNWERYTDLSYKDEAYKNLTALHFLIDTVEMSNGI